MRLETTKVQCRIYVVGGTNHTGMEHALQLAGWVQF
jgi:hypothetical protein